MTYRHMQPVGYLGALGAEGVISRTGETAAEARLREQARINAINIWNDYQALLRQGPVRELMATEPYSSSAVTSAYRLLRRGIAAGTSTRVSTREFASMLQAAMAKISLLQIKARMLSRAIDIRSAYPIVERVNAAARRLLTSVQRLIAEARPLRKEATSGAKGTSGLGFIMAVTFIGAFVITPVLMILYMESITNAEGAVRDADRWCENQRRATGTACTGDQWEAARREALEVRQQSGVANLLAQAGSGLRETWRDTTESPIGEGIGSGLMWAMIIGATAVAGLGFYAAWPYIKGARAPGERFARSQSRKTRAAEGEA